MNKAVIFDMDGVIINSEPIWQEALIISMNNHGYNFTKTMCETTKGMRVDEVTVFWKNKLNATFDPDKLKNEIVETVINLIKTTGVAMTGLTELINQLKKEHYKIAIASSSPMDIIMAVVERLALKDVFDSIHSAEFEDYGKPHPQVFITAAKALGVDAQYCTVIEDSFFGLVAAKAAKMKAIALPFEQEPQIKKFVIADYIASSHHDIAKNKPYIIA